MTARMPMLSARATLARCGSPGKRASHFADCCIRASADAGCCSYAPGSSLDRHRLLLRTPSSFGVARARRYHALRTTVCTRGAAAFGGRQSSPESSVAGFVWEDMVTLEATLDDITPEVLAHGEGCNWLMAEGRERQTDGQERQAPGLRRSHGRAAPVRGAGRGGCARNGQEGAPVPHSQRPVPARGGRAHDREDIPGDDNAGGPRHPLSPRIPAARNAPLAGAHGQRRGGYRPPSTRQNRSPGGRGCELEAGARRPRGDRPRHPAAAQGRRGARPGSSMSRAWARRGGRPR